jgi:anti-sigma factor RsiW
MVDAYVDGELSAGESVDFERALEACPDCRQRLEQARQMSALLRDLPVEPAPDLLRARIERELRNVASASASTVPQPAIRRSVAPRLRWMAMAASIVLAFGFGWMGAFQTLKGERESDELLSGYLRVAMAQTVDVASSDRHTVKPWFAGRIDYSPPVYDLTTAGFPLVGGRVDVVDGRKVAVLVYRHNQHWLALTLWPSSSSGSKAGAVNQRDGFVMADWRHDGFEMRAVADLAPAEMKAFVAATDQAIDGDH